LKRRSVLTWTGALALSLAGLWRETPAGTSGFLAPIASLAASVEWVRFDTALSRGRTDLAYERAEHALDLDPASTEGWAFFASHLVFDRGSAEVEHDPERRWEWIRAGLDLLERGEATAREPERLVLYRGLVHAALAESGGSFAMSADAHADRARALFERAGAMGLDLAAELSRSFEHDHEH
jgi:hypothetical protein